MTAVYIDGSAALVAVTDQPGAEVVRTAWRRASLVVTTRICDVQVAAAVNQAARADLLTAAQAEHALSAWQRAMAGCWIVEATAELAEVAGQIAATCDVRADDAWQIAAAARFGAETLYVTADSRARIAALERGLTVAWAGRSDH